MPRIKDASVVAVREQARIEDVVRDVVTLKSAGGNSLKGLCPFHDEDTPSFNVTPSKGMFFCFGCESGGDAIDFVRKTDHLSFSEAVEKLAGRFGVQLSYEEGGVNPDRVRGQRTRLVDAHKLAAQFYVDRLSTPDAKIGRAFLKERGFDREAAEMFGVGFAPPGWDNLTKHLRTAGFTDDELITAGLVVRGQRGPYDRFRGRLIWPIRDLSGDVVGFGARKLLDEDEGPKYLNTPETPLYKKSNVLYGIDLARREISVKQQAVIVEGYTDVMAAHLSGVKTAVATCGTAFGSEHVKILRRLLMDQNELRGEVIFTFDGDAAGRKAALRAFSEDQNFVSQTFVAIEPTGLDPCDLRLQHGPEAVRELVARRRPLFEYVIRATLDDYNLDTAEGRIAGLRATAPIVAGIRDQALRPEYGRLLAGWLGMEISAVSEALKKAPTTKRVADSSASTASTAEVDLTKAKPEWDRPDLSDTGTKREREALKCALQMPERVGDVYDEVSADIYTWEVHQLVHAAIVSAGGPQAAGSDSRVWFETVLSNCPDDSVRTYLRELTVEPLRFEPRIDDTVDEQWRQYGVAVVNGVIEMDVTRRIQELKGRLHRTNPEEQKTEYHKMFSELMELEALRRDLRDQAIGESVGNGVA